MQRRNARRLATIVALGLALLALGSYGHFNQVAAQDDVLVTLNELNGSGVSGDATLTDNGDGTTTVDIKVIGATGDHPVHIHSGTCAELGDVVYPLTDVNALGESVTVVDVPLSDLLTTGPYAINIHLSADEIGTYVACGDLPAGAVGSETATEVPATTATAEASPAAVGGTSSVTDIGTSGVGTTSNSNTGFLALAVGALALVIVAGAFGVRGKDARD